MIILAAHSALFSFFKQSGGLICVRKRNSVQISFSVFPQGRTEIIFFDTETKTPMLYSNSFCVGVQVCEFQFSASDNPFPSGGTDAKKVYFQLYSPGEHSPEAVFKTCNSLQKCIE